MKKLVLCVTVLFLFATLFAVAEGSQEKGSGDAKMEAYNIAFSNGLITHSWRTQMVKGIQEAVAFYEGRGLIDNFYLQHAGFDLDLQVQHIRNFINMGVDAIIVDALSLSALNPVMEEAMDEGIVVVACDMPVTSDKVWQVRPDHVAWIEKLARYVFERMDGEGDLVYLSGIDGAPVSDMRDDGFEKAIADYPDINLLTKSYGNWDPSQAMQAMGDVLAAYPDIDGVVSQDGQCISVVRSFESVNRPLPVMNGEYSRDFCEYWVENLDEGFTSYAIVHGPSQVVTAALAVTINLLQGKEFKDNLPEGVRMEGKTLIFDWRQEITDENVEQLLEEHIRERGIEDYIDAVWEYDEVSEWFK
jgi:ribose transport system substrate-binding protein